MLEQTEATRVKFDEVKSNGQSADTQSHRQQSSKTLVSETEKQEQRFASKSRKIM